MTIDWKATVAATATAIALLGAGFVSAKDHPHGGPGTHAKGPGSANHGQGHGQGPKSGGPRSASCDSASSAIGAFIDVTCPCAGQDDGTGTAAAWKNHGQYVRCVAHAVKDATRDAGVKRRCGRGYVSCAARSTCGKRGVTSCADAKCCLGSASGAFVD